MLERGGVCAGIFRHERIFPMVSRQVRLQRHVVARCRAHAARAVIVRIMTGAPGTLGAYPNRWLTAHVAVREARRGCSGAMARPDSRGRALAGLPHSWNAPVSPLAPWGTSVQARPFQIDLGKVRSAVLTVASFFCKPAKAS